MSPQKRSVIVGLCLVGAAISARLAAYQLRWTGAPWEPLFGNGTKHVLKSAFSQSLPFPDAALGMTGYLAEAATLAWGSRAHSQTRAVAIYAYATIASSMAFASGALLLVQVLWIRALCTLCLASAVLSLALVVPAVAELRTTRRDSRARRCASIGKKGASR